MKPSAAPKAPAPTGHPNIFISATPAAVLVEMGSAIYYSIELKNPP
jgi:hypothetical protein